MFDNYVLSNGEVKNIVSDREENRGEIVGYEMKTLICYYRGIPLSMVHDVEVQINGEKEDRSLIYFSCDGEDFFTLDELETVADYKWEYGTEATVFVKKPGGLSKGTHKVTLSTVIRNEYVPVPFSGTRTVEVTIE